MNRLNYDINLAQFDTQCLNELEDARDKLDELLNDIEDAEAIDEEKSEALADIAGIIIRQIPDLLELTIHLRYMSTKTYNAEEVIP